MGVRTGVRTGANPGWAIEGIAPPKTYELTLFTMTVMGVLRGGGETGIFPPGN